MCLSKFCIYACKDSNHTMTFFYRIKLHYLHLVDYLSYEGIWVHYFLEICKTVCNVNIIKMNEKIMYLLIMLLFGCMAPMIQTWERIGRFRLPKYGCPHILTNSGSKTNNWSVGKLNIYYTCLYHIVVTYIIVFSFCVLCHPVL